MREHPFELVIFDNDGVLVDSEPIANAVLAQMLTEAGVPHTVEESVARYLGSSLARVRSQIRDRYGIDLPGDFEDHYHERLFQRFERELHPMPGVIPLLDHLEQAGVAICVASSGVMERIELSLDLTNLLSRFAGRIFSAEQVERGKPSPDLFLFAARHMGVSPTRSAVVEDSSVGIEAANAAGMTSFGFGRTGNLAVLDDASGGVVTSMQELAVRLT